MSGNGGKESLHLPEKGDTVRNVEGGHDFYPFHPIADEAVKAALFKPWTRLSILKAVRTENPK